VAGLAAAGPALPDAFFDRDAAQLARELLGKVIRHRVGGLWLSARIIETEAYYLEEKGSHASLGYTHKRRALFMDGGTVYMYYARGGDSLNFSAAGPGNAVLIKSGYPWTDARSGPQSLARMQALNPDAQGRPRPPSGLCAGQPLRPPRPLCGGRGGSPRRADLHHAPGHSAGPGRTPQLPLRGPVLRRLLHAQPVAARAARRT
jgi:DNA-3-methyladenine glycosylase